MHTRETLSEGTDFDAEARMEILQGRGTLHDAAQAAFEQHVRQPGQMLALPFEGWVATLRDEGHPELPYRRSMQFDASCFNKEGDTGSLKVTVTATHFPHFRLSLSQPRAKANLSVDWQTEQERLVIKRTANELRQPSPEALDERLNVALSLLVALDPVWPSWILDRCTDPFDPSHTVLRDLQVPHRHRPIVAKILGAPYAAAHKAAARLKAKSEAKATAVADHDKTAADYPDGAMFVRVGSRAPKVESRLTLKHAKAFYIVTTDSAPGAKRRKRTLTGLGLDTSDKPFTPRHFMKLRQIHDPRTLDMANDLIVGFHHRDLLMGALHLAPHLAPGALNPVLSDEPRIGEIELDGAPYNLRVSQAGPKDGYALNALRIIHADGQAVGNCREGAGIMFVSAPKVDWAMALRPIQDRLGPDDPCPVFRTADAAILEHALAAEAGAIFGRPDVLLRRAKAAFAEICPR